MFKNPNILVATDFSSAADVGIDKAAELARETQATVTVCHVLDPSPMAPIATKSGTDQNLESSNDIEKALHNALSKLIDEKFSDLEGTKTALIISTNAADGICNYARKENTDIIVLSTHGRTGMAHLLIGSVAEQVVRHAPCPVLTVRTSD